jgi:hypothetical protein
VEAHGNAQEAADAEAKRRAEVEELARIKFEENRRNIPQIPVKEKMVDVEAALAATQRSRAAKADAEKRAEASRKAAKAASATAPQGKREAQAEDEQDKKVVEVPLPPRHAGERKTAEVKMGSKAQERRIEGPREERRADAAPAALERAKASVEAVAREQNARNIPQIPVKAKMLDVEAALAATQRSQAAQHDATKAAGEAAKAAAQHREAKEAEAAPVEKVAEGAKVRCTRS